MLRVNALAKIPCPNLDKIPTERINKVAEVFDEISMLELLPACQAHSDEVRNKIDQAVIKMLDIDPVKASDTIKSLRWLWCNEPTVHGCNRKALKLLEREE